MRIGNPWLSRRTDHSDTPVVGELSSGDEVVVDRGGDKAVDTVRPGPGKQGRVLTISC